MPEAAFAAAIREVGVEDAAALVAAASNEQLVAAFDQDLFVNERPGEREALDRARLVVWLEVLLEAGDDVAARRLAELSEDFVLAALSSLVRVLEHDALRDRMLGVEEDDADAADAVEKALESSLSQEVDGFLLVSRDGQGWDAVVALVLALDRDHRALLERVLTRAARLSSRLVRDLDALAEVLSDAESLAEDVEAEREDRRGAAGFVEPRAARSFLELARAPQQSGERDIVTKSYFRALDAGSFGGSATPPARVVKPSELPRLVGPAAARSARPHRFAAALRLLAEEAPAEFHARMEELLYLANVLSAGATGRDGARLSAAEAAQAALATVALGATLEITERTPTARRLCAVLAAQSADALFRRASSALAAIGRSPAFLCALDEAGAARSRVAEKGLALSAGR